MSSHRRVIFVSLGIFGAVGLLLLIAFGIPALAGWVNGIHPRNVARMLASWGQEYSHPANAAEAARSVGMLGAFKNHYRYEDIPEERDIEAVKELAAQRDRTLQLIAEGLRRYSGQDFGSDADQWRAWLATNAADDQD